MTLRSYASSTLRIAQLLIPVKLYSSKRDDPADVELRTLHAKCGVSISKKDHCAKCKVDVEKGDTIKGYEFAKDRILKLTDEDVKALRSEGPTGIEALHSITPALIPSHYLSESLIYLGANAGGHEAFAALVRALQSSQLGLLARFISPHNSQSNMLIRSKERGLEMHSLRYFETLHPLSALDDGEEVDVPTARLKLMRSLVKEHQVSEFNPKEWPNLKAQRMKALLDARAKGEAVALVNASGEPAGEIADLEDVLRRSLDEIQRAKKNRRGPTPAETRKAARAARRAG